MGDVILGDNVTIHPSARFTVSGYLYIGSGSTIGERCVIEGRDIRIGDEFWMDAGAVIGGGSCHDRLSSLRAGHFLHMGRDSFINTARPVTIGHEVGLGTRTALYTHGAYPSALDGFPAAFGPISIGDHSWLPGAIVNPGVNIGADVVVGVGSVVTKSIPSGSLAAGTPAVVIRENAYPRPLLGEAKAEFWRTFLADYPDEDAEIHVNGTYVRTGETYFHHDQKHITGPVTDASEMLRNQLRRYGIRFWSRPKGGMYCQWLPASENTRWRNGR
jgi:acetyltransferase-like isoleucine patch superfamily enzyme